MNSHEPYHEGEVAIQERTGERPDALRRAAMIRNSLTEAARDFLSSQQAIAIAAVDDLGRPWASLWLGSPGFVTALSDVAMRVRRPRPPSHDDPLEALLSEGRSVGTLAIDFATRGRLRVNGILAAASDDFIDVTVREAFPNCKKYIQQRAQSDENPATLELDAAVAHGERLGPRQRTALGSVDTVFVGSRHPDRGIDVSHRGGGRGFVRVLDERTVRFPDYPGNGMFQTLGNFEVDPRAGVLAVDFERARLLSLTGRVTVTFGPEENEHPTGGTGRYWTLTVDEWVDLPMASGRDFFLIEPSPSNPLPFSTASCATPPVRAP